MSITTYQQHEAHARAVRQDHYGRTSRGLSVEIARLAFDNPIFRDDPAELLSDLKQCAAACIGAGCEPRVRPLPGQDGQGVSLAAPAEADQVEGTPTSYQQLDAASAKCDAITTAAPLAASMLSLPATFTSSLFLAIFCPRCFSISSNARPPASVQAANPA